MKLKSILFGSLFSVFGSLGFYCLSSYLLLSCFRYEFRLEYYPYFIPFCKMAGIFSLMICLLLLSLNISVFFKEFQKIEEAQKRKKQIFHSVLTELVITFLLFLPLLLFWETLKNIVGSWF